ncbi:MAG: hypothetical protein PHE56_07705 [Bacteroidales bacterium]|nr:hypothetical protein [Bacteroidales bacterium]
MKTILLFLVILISFEAFPSIEFYNYNREQKSRKFIEFASLNNLQLLTSLNSRKLYDFKPNISDLALLKTIDTIAVNHNRKTNNPSKKNYFQNSNFDYNYKVLGIVNDSYEKYHLVILCQQNEVDKFFKMRNMVIYLINLDQNYHLVSTAIIGNLYQEHITSFFKITTQTTINSNHISIREEVVNGPFDIRTKCWKRKKLKTEYYYKFEINNKGEIEVY